MSANDRLRVGVVGLGYVGLPLALAFGRVLPTFGFDLNSEKLEAYRQGIDPSGEMPAINFKSAKHLSFDTSPSGLANCNRIIIAVPTPITSAHQPDLTDLESACRIVAAHLTAGCIVIFESTVYPGVTEEICAPILERNSGLTCGVDFKLGYSPERINPGDHEHTLENIVKVVAGQDESTLEEVATLYEKIIEAGVHRAPSIRVAEAAKVIENTQRDANIALINEFALIFHQLGIDTMDVLEAAATKWNFLPFRPGLVGGHCIGVDPYYLTHKAEIAGYRPEIIQAARRTNDAIGKWLAEQTIREIIRAGSKVKGARVAVLGLTFKEDCADLRNSKVIDCINALLSIGVELFVHDPVAHDDDAQATYKLGLTDWEDLSELDAVVLAVAHRQYRDMAVADIRKACKKNAVIMDVKSILDRKTVAEEGLRLWRM